MSQLTDEDSILTTYSSSSSSNWASFNKEEVEKQISQWKNKLDKNICPISHRLMIDPVIIETGHTFERQSIKAWFKSKKTCPISKKKIKSKNLTPNINVKSTIHENIETFIKKVIKYVQLWKTDINLIEICVDLLDETFELIKDRNDFNNCQNELFDIYIKLIKELPVSNNKILQLQNIENKLTNEVCLQQYYYELLNLLVDFSDNNTDLLIEAFTKYCNLNGVDDNLVNKIYNYLNFQNNDIIVLDFLIILFTNTNYSRTMLLQKLLNIKIDNVNKFVTFFKDLLKEINLNEIDLETLINFIKNYDELKDEQITIYKELYKNSNEIKYLEFIYNLNKNNKEIELHLLSEYLKLKLIEKYLNLYIKINEDKLDLFNITFLKYLQNEMIILRNENINVKNKFNNLENQIGELNILKEDKNNLKNSLQYLFTEIKTLQNDKDQKVNQKVDLFLENEDLKKEVLEIKNSLQKNIKEYENIILQNNNLKETINNQNIEINNLKQITEKQNKELQEITETLNSLKEWKNQQIINKFKKKYPEYDYVNIINIETPLNVKQNERFFSDEFEVFGLKWKICIFLKMNECAIYLHLNSLQYKNENKEVNKSSSIKIKYSIDSINLNDNKNFEYNFTATVGYGSLKFRNY